MAPSPRRKLSPVPPVAGVKRPAASLLPAFEPFSSSPVLPRAVKRSREFLDEPTYPTPVPTSSTLMPTSSPTRPSKKPTRASLTDRSPLADVPSVEIPKDGRVVLMGRSSASCHYQFPASRLISRVHMAVSFKIAEDGAEHLEIVCSGWNGLKIHGRGKIIALDKGDTFTSSQSGTDIIVDVADSRVCVKWPAEEDAAFTSGSSDEGSPTRELGFRAATPVSPLRARAIASPVSPSPAVRALMPSSPPNPFQLSAGPIVVHEDPSASPEPVETPAAVTQSTQKLTQPLSSTYDLQDFSDQDEENDPVIHSFGPFGANLLPRMASFTTGSPNPPARAHPLAASVSPAQQTRLSFDIKSHIINQLAYSRLSSTPLSTLISHFPDDAGSVSTEAIQEVITATDCIGVIAREGKDANGKQLESEYYYLAEKDEDHMRKQAVMHDLGKPGLRNCRKQHKQYFWRKPKKA